MNKNKMTILAVCAAVVVCVSVLTSFYMSSVGSRPAPIVLPSPPETAASAPDDSSDSSGGGEIPDRLVLTRKNVRGAVAALSRPSEYSAEISVRLSYASGSSESVRKVKLRSGYQHTFAASGLGAGRHIISGGGKSFRWEDGDTHFYVGQSGGVDHDDELWIPTYEDVADIRESEITDVGYVDKNGYACVFLAAEEASGRMKKFWVSIDFGLLVASEILDQEGAQIYSMSLLSLSLELPPDSDFMLPGSVSVFSAGE